MEFAVVYERTSFVCASLVIRGHAGRLCRCLHCIEPAFRVLDRQLSSVELRVTIKIYASRPYHLCVQSASVETVIWVDLYCSDRSNIEVA